MNSGQETRPKSLAEEDAEEIYNFVKSLRSDARREIRSALWLSWPLGYSCPCGARIHPLSEYLGIPIRIESIEEIWGPLFGARIKLRWLEGEHEAFIWSRAIVRKLKRLLKNKESVWVKPRLKLDLEAG